MRSTKTGVVFLALTAMLLTVLTPMAAQAVTPGGDFGACDGLEWLKFDGHGTLGDASDDAPSGSVISFSDFIEKDDEAGEVIGFTWSSTVEVASVHTKSGNNAHVDSGTSGTSGSVLTAADGPAISHVVFCFPGADDGDDPFDGVGVAGAFICKAQADGDFELYRGGDQDPQWQTQTLQQGDYVWRFTNPNDEQVSFTAGINGIGYFGETTIEAGQVIFLTSTSSIGGLSTLTEGEVELGRHSTNENPCDEAEATPTLTVEKVWTGDDEGSAEATFEIYIRAPFQDGRGGNDRIPAATAAESGDSIDIPADARGIEISESVTGLPAGCESVLVAIVDDQGFGSSDTDGLGDYGISLLEWQDESIVVTFTNDVECGTTPTTPTPTPTTPPAEEQPEEPKVMAAVVEPTAVIRGECPDEGVVIEGSYELDNSTSNMDVTYDVAIGRADQVLIVEGGETYVNTFRVAPGDGEVEVVISVRGTDLVFSETFDARDCVDEPDVAVEGVVEEKPAALPVAQPVAAAPAALPETGVSALLLTLMGLLSLGFGGALLRPRKRG